MPRNEHYTMSGGLSDQNAGLADKDAKASRPRCHCGIVASFHFIAREENERLMCVPCRARCDVCLQWFEENPDYV